MDAGAGVGLGGLRAASELHSSAAPRCPLQEDFPFEGADPVGSSAARCPLGQTPRESQQPLRRAVRRGREGPPPQLWTSSSGGGKADGAAAETFSAFRLVTELSRGGSCPARRVGGGAGSAVVEVEQRWRHERCVFSKYSINKCVGLNKWHGLIRVRVTSSPALPSPLTCLTSGPIPPHLSPWATVPRHWTCSPPAWTPPSPRERPTRVKCYCQRRWRAAKVAMKNSPTARLHTRQAHSAGRDGLWTPSS